MGVHLLLFVGVAAIVIVVPGPDTAVVTKNVLLHGRRTAFATSFGVAAGLALWTIAAAVGVAFVAMTVVWLSFYCVVTARAAGALQRPRVRAWMDRITGVVLIAIGLRLATERP